MNREELKKLIEQIKKYNLTNAFDNTEEFDEWLLKLNEKRIRNFNNLSVEPSSIFFPRRKKDAFIPLFFSPSSNSGVYFGLGPSSKVSATTGCSTESLTRFIIPLPAMTSAVFTAATSRLSESL